MSIFGSREDDPLLQNDPLAPSPDDEPPDDAAAAEDEDSETTRDAPASEESAPGSGRGTTQSVFGAPPDAQDQLSGGERGRGENVIVRPIEEARNGRLAQVNTAFDAGWRLRRVELRNEDPDDRAPPGRGPSRSIAFVFHRPDS